MLVSVGFGMMSSDSAEAAFVEPLTPSPDLPSTFVAYDTAWNEAGTMAVVVGFDSFATPGTNAYAYYPVNDSYWPIDNDGWNQQKLHAVDYFREPVYDWPSVLLVDADWMEENLISYYQDIFSNCEAYVDTWDVWFGMGHGMSENQGKPTAADMTGYDLVVWIPSRYMTGMYGGGDAFNIGDQNQVALYLNGGGNFFLSNLEYSSWYSFAGPGNFGYDYFGVSGIMTTSNYEYWMNAQGSDSVYGGLGREWMNWYSYGWSGYPSQTDILYGMSGTADCFQGEDNSYNLATTGIRYDIGIFKTVYLGFPLETLPVYYAAGIMQRTLDWLTAPVPDQFDEYMVNGGWIDVGMSTGNPWAQSFIPSQSSISKVEFYMYSMSSTTDYFEIEIRQDVGGIPSTGYITYGYIGSSSIPVGSPAWVSCDFGSGISLTIGQTYWIVCTRIGFSVQQNWLADYSMTYPRGVAIYDMGGSVWTGPQTYDWLFRTYPQSGSSGTPKSINLYPFKDNTIYSEYTSNSNGAGEYIIAGTDYYPHYRRALMEFDIASSIPKFSTINSVSLNLYCSYVYDSMGYDVELMPLMDEWGEAGSDAPGMEDTGTSAMTGDATWDYAYYMSSSWMPGGDYGAGAGYSWVTNSGTSYVWSDTGMVNNVQTWLDNPTTNHGWLLRGDEGPAYSAKWFNSRNSPSGNWPMLTIIYTEPTIIGYRDVFWIAGDTYGPTPPATCYKVIPSERLRLKPMTGGVLPQFFTLAVDDTGGVLCAGQGIPNMYYYNGDSWFPQFSPEDLTAYAFHGLDFNPNDGRFYATGMDFAFYTDTIPLTSGSSQCYRFNHFPDYGGSLDSQLAWNDLYDYGLVGGDTYLIKIWPYDEFSNGTVRYQLIRDNSQEHFLDISWDTDGWNEAGIMGGRTGGRAYWRYYNSNPQLLDGYFGAAGTYYTGAMKPPSSPKWLFIPFAAGGNLRVNVEEKDQSSELVVAATFPHIFTLDMWKQSDPSRLSVLNTQVEADTTFTFFIECNYTTEGVDQWDTALGMYFQGWFDMGNTGVGSVPGDNTWTMDMYRTRQFNISYSPVLGTATMNYPASVGGVQEFAIHSVWEDPVNYGADLSHYRLYINVTFRQQTEMAPGDGLWNPGNSWDQNSLNDPWTWDFKALLYDTGLPEASNSSYAEFGVQRYAALSVSGNPTGSIPPGSSAILATPSRITYSSNTPYQLNVSIPNLYKDGNVASPYWIPAAWVSVMNDQGDDTNANSDIWDWRPFVGPNDAWCIWGLESGTYLSMPGHGTVTAGPFDTDYSMAPLPFQPTPVMWQVGVPAGTPEGVYRGTITITLWSL